jgi:L-amino acid N-acyltransferase YncA
MAEAVVRVAKLEDAPAIAAIYAPYVRDTFISFEDEPPAAAEIGRRMTTGLSAYPWLVAEQDGEVAGYTYAGLHRAPAAYAWSINVSIYLRQGLQRRGLGHRLYRSLFDVARRQGFLRVYGGIALPNEASVGLHEAMGFKPIGVYRGVGYKFGAWRDVGWWGLDLREPPADPAPPAPFDPSLAEAVLASENGRART